MLSTGDGQVGSFDPLTGNFTSIAEGEILSDIAALDEDQVFGINFTSLYEIDLESGQFSIVDDLGRDDFVGLDFTPDGDLYSIADSGFYQIDPITGEATLVSDLGSDFLSSGDLVFNPEDEVFYATSVRTISSDVLYEINLDGEAVEIGDIGFDGVWGLTFDESGNLFGYTSQGEQISIDETTGIGTFEQDVTGLTGDIAGATDLISTSTSFI